MEVQLANPQFQVCGKSILLTAQYNGSYGFLFYPSCILLCLHLLSLSKPRRVAEAQDDRKITHCRRERLLRFVLAIMCPHSFPPKGATTARHALTHTEKPHTAGVHKGHRNVPSHQSLMFGTSSLCAYQPHLPPMGGRVGIFRGQCELCLYPGANF